MDNKLKYGKSLIKSYFETQSFLGSNIESFNNLIEKELNEILEENRVIEPTILPQSVEKFKIKFDKIWVTKPEITEADGSKRNIYPTEARLRKITYSAPIYVEVSAHVNDIQKESVTVQIGNLPIMLKSNNCHLCKLGKEELVQKGEDPEDPGGYFIINGTEKVLVHIEDLAPNRILIEEDSSSTEKRESKKKFVGKVFSERGSFKIPHSLERSLKNGIFYISFTRVKKIPLIVLLKALGMLKDEDIINYVNPSRQFDEVKVNLLEFVTKVKTEEEAIDYIAKQIGITQAREVRLERTKEVLDKYLLPHLGIEQKDRLAKAYNLCKLMKKYILVSRGELPVDDKDHYMNKKLKLSGDLLADLLRVNFKVLVGDLLYNFQRIVKRGKFPSIKQIVREKLLTQRIDSAMATGNWVGGRKGVCQRIQRLNFLETISHLQRVVSPLSASQENFEARALHATHLGRLCPIETPEGTNIGLRKNLSLLASISEDSSEEEVIKAMKNHGLKGAPEDTKESDRAEKAEMEAKKFSEVYVNSKFQGYISYEHYQENFAEEFVSKMKEERRRGDISPEVNFYLNDATKDVYVETLKGRLRRPLVVVRDGRPLLTEEHVRKLETREIKWDDLAKDGVIESIDASEEENCLVAFNEDDLTQDHTHLEISPLTMLGLTASLVPYGNYNQSTRLNAGAKNQKQAIGFYASNFSIRMDMDVNILHYPQKPVVQTIINDIWGYEKHAAGQNIIVAVMSYKGYNMEDAIVINRGSVDRGFGRSTYYRPSIAEEIRYPGGMVDEVSIPDKDVKGYKSEKDYRFLEEDGIIQPEVGVEEGDVIIGKTSPPRFLSSLDEYSIASSTRRESSVSLKHGEKGVVDFVLITENEEGNRLVQVRVRDSRVPEIGDKFTSRHGQKGVVGLIIPPEDMPFSASGIVPDLLFSPHGIPSRMTIAHLIELIGGKTGALSGRYIDGTSFDESEDADKEELLRKELLAAGFRENGTETFYNGETGEKFEAKIYAGNMYYLKLKHMVANKLHSRARGPIQLLTRQPTEGRAKEGGLRLGEMEKDTFVAHGASLLLKERFDSDRTIVPVCENCGLIAVSDEFRKKISCPRCGDNVEISNVEISYAFKLIMDEFKSLGIYPRMILKSKY